VSSLTGWLAGAFLFGRGAQDCASRTKSKRNISEKKAKKNLPKYVADNCELQIMKDGKGKSTALI
jgi:hypothetical protein